MDAEDVKPEELQGYYQNKAFFEHGAGAGGRRMFLGADEQQRQQREERVGTLEHLTTQLKVQQEEDLYKFRREQFKQRDPRLSQSQTFGFRRSSGGIGEEAAAEGSDIVVELSGEETGMEC